ncbi:small integral membrane protein 22 [Sorex araneus]|uniref:small integral membrane protein 22 n=1 Tax=Sorex araneus TaxID=42254 RepID=UPI002433FC80|nr:small integral membrane protein 22 [Sorex araneus]XP_054990971.1 small integral membrane protein 22 [Sorex araneus]
MGDLEATAQDVLETLRTKELFQTPWDKAAFVIFLIFTCTVLLLLLLVLIRCCCCCCCCCRRQPRQQQVSPVGRGRGPGRGRPCGGRVGGAHAHLAFLRFSCRSSSGAWTTWPWSLSPAQPRPLRAPAPSRGRGNHQQRWPALSPSAPCVSARVCMGGTALAGSWEGPRSPRGEGKL